MVVRVYRMHMRSATLFLSTLLTVTAIAQPGWQGMDVHFAVYDQGIHRSWDELRQDPTFKLVMDGNTGYIGGNSSDRFCYAGFADQRSDPSMHKDTLWMELALHGEWMRIGFPPRGFDAAQWYSTSGLRIDFQPVSVLVTVLPKEFHVTGVIRNHAELLARMPFYEVQLRSGAYASIDPVLDRSTGRISGIVPCRTIMIDGQEWVDLTLSVHEGYGVHRSGMHLRSGYFLHYDLGTFDLLPGHYFFNSERLWPDPAVARDSLVVGGDEGTQLHIRPINPVTTDTLRLEAEWPSSNEPVLTAHRINKRKDGTHITFTFAVRTDVRVVTESWTERAPFMELPDLPPGRYMLSQERCGQRNARDVDLLLGREVILEVAGQR